MRPLIQQVSYAKRLQISKASRKKSAWMRQENRTALKRNWQQLRFCPFRGLQSNWHISIISAHKFFKDVWKKLYKSIISRVFTRMLTSTRNSIYTLEDFWSERPSLLLMPWVSGRAWASIGPEQQFTTLPSVSSYAATLPLLSINGVLTTSITTRHWKYHGEQENHLVSLEGQRLGQRWHTNMPLQSHVVNAAVIIQCFGGPAGKKRGERALKAFPWGAGGGR